VGRLVTVFGVSQRRACRVVGQHRSTQRLAPPVRSDAEQALRSLRRLSRAATLRRENRANRRRIVDERAVIQQQ